MMGENTKIEWTGHTFNPWTGCTKISPGCDHCYAESWAKRAGTVRWGVGEPRRRTTAANWRLPLKWNAQAEREGRRFRVFCASLADVFGNAVPDEWRADLFRLIRATPRLDWLLLTKRVGNACAMIDDARERGHLLTSGSPEWPWPNVWIGATVVNQEEADRDIPKLLATPAAVRFLSIEPMLGPITIDRRLIEQIDGTSQHGPRFIDWIICGGESGPKARPMHPDWARSLRDQCAAAGVPFLFKQWGEWLPAETDKPGDGECYAVSDDGTDRELTGRCALTVLDAQEFLRMGKRIAGRMLDGRTHDEYPA
jgi:protein gp37